MEDQVYYTVEGFYWGCFIFFVGLESTWVSPVGIICELVQDHWEPFHCT